jgi:hypothetical protein
MVRDEGGVHVAGRGNLRRSRRCLNGLLLLAPDYSPRT